MESSAFPATVRAGGVEFALDDREILAAAFRFAMNRRPTVDELDRSTFGLIGGAGGPWTMFLKLRDETPKLAEEVPK